ncbi:MAG: hypothetical protein II885_04995 [Oscillospiraceae bacterium]|jgi:hypothetical protein|nr:hypothetical protein [Oscillospiraceae bacterium]MCR5843620.1 hypothetical protein [Oscillospiraceae bacterium]
MFSIFETIFNLIAGRLFLNKIGGFIKKTVLVLAGVIAVLFVVYFWNLDQKLLGWAYKQVNLIFDRKKVDQVF